ncbi:MAG: amino acid permease [Bacteroidales bacterium]|nr:amino acid permease [Bacteroidales bacterium]
MTEDEGLKREIGLWGLVSNSINIIIGAGIFILPALVAERLGSGSIWAYLVCGFLMIFIMLCFAEIGSMITRTGGAYSYIETAFGKYAGFMTTNIFIFGAAIMANAAVANGLADTLAYFIPQFELQWVRILFFGVVFGGLAYLNIRGIKNAIMIVKINTIAKLVPLLMIGLLGWFFINPSDSQVVATNSSRDLGEISLILLFAFVGAETALNVSGEIKNPVKTIPKGIMLSILIVVILYILIQLTVQGILGSSIVDFRNAPLAEAGKRMFGPIGVTIVLVGASFSMFGNISGMVLNMPRILFAAARDKVLKSEALASVHPKFRTPYVSIIVYAAIGFIFASIGEFRQLAMLSSASYLLIYLGVILALIRFRIKNYGEKGHYRIPGGYIIPGISILTIIWVLSNLPLKELGAMAIFIIILTVVYFIYRLVRKEEA